MRAKGLFLVPFIIAFTFTAWLFYSWLQSEDTSYFTILQMLVFAVLPFMGVYLITFIISLFVVSIRK